MSEAKQSAGQSRDLGSVVRFNFLKTALIPILTVQLVLYFFSAGYITDKNLDLLRDNALSTVTEMTKTEAKNFDDQLKEISRNSLSLQAEHQRMFQAASPNFDYEKPFFFEEVGYQLDRNLNPIGYSSLFLSPNTTITPHLRRKMVKTQGMDIRFKTLVDNNPSLVSAFFHSWDNMIRMYPLQEKLAKSWSESYDVEQDSVYANTSKRSNPNRDPVWTKVYMDPAGKGWMLSNLVPIYQNNFLEGVTGLDVTLNTFSKHILSANLQWESGALVMDKHGNILSMSRAAEIYLGLMDVSDYNYKDNPVDRSLTKPTMFNLLKQNTLAGMYFSEFFNGNEGSLEFTMHGEEYLVSRQSIPETGWQLFIMAPLKNVYGPILEEKAELTKFGFTFLGLAAFFYLLYFSYIRRSSHKLAMRIAKPIKQVTSMIMARDTNDEAYTAPEPVNITELDELLSMNIKIQNSKLRYQKISREMLLKNEQLKMLAITDQLTQIYNRLKLDEVLGYELARSRRDKSPLTVAIMDIDKFKSVNDTYGHQVGDSVLINVAQIMQKNIRSTDILGRWGGEEFMLILPNTPIESAEEHCNRLRQIIAQTDFKPVEKVTISMGLATCATFMCEKVLIELADNALYEAKENGRNRVVLAPLVTIGEVMEPEAARYAS